MTALSRTATGLGLALLLSAPAHSATAHAGAGPEGRIAPIDIHYCIDVPDLALSR